MRADMRSVAYGIGQVGENLNRRPVTLEAILRRTLALILAASALLHAAPARAQDGGPDQSSVRVRIGPLMMNPIISLTNIGIDHNVFNEPDSAPPKEDFTFTVTPATDFWLHLGPTWVTASLIESINWYQKYASERTANSEYKLGWNVPGSIVGFKINYDYTNQKDRPGFEIDERVEHKGDSYGGSVDFHALSKTTIGVNGNYMRTRFASGQTYEGVDLQESLSRTSTTVGVNLRHQLTPLTGISFTGSRVMDRFIYSPERDSNADSVNLAMTFTPGALFTGSASVGYDRFKPIDPTLPGFTGVIANVGLTYVLLGSTRFALAFTRGVQYSYDVNQPYYVQTGGDLSVAQQIFGPVDVAAHGGTELLSYRDRLGASVPVPGRQDHVDAFGVGVGYHIGKDLRLSFNVDKVYRQTEVADRQYQNWKFGSSLNYGF